MPVLPPLVCLAPNRQHEAEAFAVQFALSLQDHLPSDGYALVLRETQLSLEHPHAHGAVMAEFVEGAAAHRRQFGGGKGQPVAKAIGIKGSYLPQVALFHHQIGDDGRRHLRQIQPSPPREHGDVPN